jgi:phytoene synthase
MSDLDDVDAAVRKADPDRWWASRFIADPAARADVVALYALNHELVHIVEAVRDPFIGEIRLTWWREALDAAFAGEPARTHPVMRRLAAAIGRGDLDRSLIEGLIAARADDLESRRFADEVAVNAYIDATAGAIMALAAAILGAGDMPAVKPAARAWALAGLQRNRTAGRDDRLPRGWSVDVIYARVGEALAEARATARAAPVAAFPAIAYATLAKPYAAGRAPSEFEKRFRLTAAVLTGRL